MIGEELESLNISKEMLHRFRVTEDKCLEKQADTVQDEEGFVEMDDHGGRIRKSFPRNLLGTGDNVLEIQPSKKRKIDVEADVHTGVPLSVTETETDVVFTLEMPGLHKEPSKLQSTDDEQPSTAHSNTLRSPLPPFAPLCSPSAPFAPLHPPFTPFTPLCYLTPCLQNMLHFTPL